MAQGKSHLKFEKKIHAITSEIIDATEAQILVSFALRLAVSEIQHIQGQQISEMHPMIPNCT